MQAAADKSWDLRLSGMGLRCSDLYSRYPKLNLVITTVVKRYARANNEYAVVNDPESDNTYLLYVDANNL